MSKPYLVAVDPGFGYHKGMSNVQKAFSFPSYACYGSLSDIRGIAINESHISTKSLVVQYEDEVIFLGKLAKDLMPEDASRPQSLNKADDQLQRALILTTIALSLPAGSYHSVYLGMGLSNASISNGYDKGLLQWLEGELHRITLFAGKTPINYIIKVEGAIIRSQPEGTLMWESLDFRTLTETKKWKESYRDHVGLIDIGHNSTDASIFKTLRMVSPDRLNVATYGVSAVFDKLSALLSNRFAELNYVPRQSDLDGALEGSNTIRIAGSVYDISKEIDAAARVVAQNIIGAIRNKWAQELPRLEAVWIFGGGGLLLQNHLRLELLKLKVAESRVVENPQYSNVFGFYMWAYLKFQAELDVSLDVLNG